MARYGGYSKMLHLVIFSLLRIIAERSKLQFDVVNPEVCNNNRIASSFLLPMTTA
jgi:hypothetical protein